MADGMTRKKQGTGGADMRTEYLLDKEMEHVLALLTTENRMVMRVCLHTGLRLGDVLRLKKTQLGPHFWVTEAKTGKHKQVGLPEPLLSDLLDSCRWSASEWVFPGRIDPEKHRTRQAVWADVKRAAKALRMQQNVGPHSARKMYAVHLMQEYGSIRKVQRALNHSDESVTMLYAMADQLLRQKAKKPRRRA
jgi:integrase